MATNKDKRRDPPEPPNPYDLRQIYEEMELYLSLIHIYCELLGICYNPDKLLAFMMQPATDDDQQLLQEPQGTE